MPVKTIGPALIISVLIGTSFGAGVTGAIYPADAASPNKSAKLKKHIKRGTGRPLPRFASLRSREANLRTGPGVRYPVEWVYKRSGLPIKIIAEFDIWRKVEDWRGTVGWMHRSMLSGKRTVITTGNMTVLRRNPEAASPAMAKTRSGVIAKVLACAGPWCRIRVQGIKGWATRASLWGILAHEQIKK
ncbi:MAG: SH3 domain-containing protein [Alphaproteobacteria bacterium]